MPDISLLPSIASFYDTTVDFLLGCDAIRKKEDIAAFTERAQALLNQGKRKERLELCREYQKKYPNDETVLHSLMYDLFAVDWKDNSDEIISIANKLLSSNNTQYHFGAVQLLAFIHSKLGNYDTAVKYARSIPANKDILKTVLKGDELVEHCKWYIWGICDNIYHTVTRFWECAEADYSAVERYKIGRSVYEMFNAVFSDGDFGFWEERLSYICRDMAKCSAEIGENDRAFSELEEMCKHVEKFKEFKCIDHTSPLVKGLHYDIAGAGKNSEESLASIILYGLNNNKHFKSLENDIRFAEIKETLEALA